jgi:HicA toxin of bacterial toxin-antitoxin,
VKHQKLEQLMREHGAEIKRQGAKHTIWFIPATGQKSTVPRHNEIKKNTARSNLPTARHRSRESDGLSSWHSQNALLCSSDQFSSTNRSNVPMQALFGKVGFERSGIIHNLDPGDPELG